MTKKDKIKQNKIFINLDNSKRIRLTKVFELSDAIFPNNIEKGAIRVGFFTKEPTIGERFGITDTIQGIHFEIFSTSDVQEIIDEHTFRTYNSIYHWEYIK